MSAARPAEHSNLQVDAAVESEGDPDREPALPTDADEQETAANTNATGPGGGGLLPASYWEELAAALTRDDDNDAAFGDDGSSIVSLSSSILEYRELYGRTYHSRSFQGVEYWGANDEKQVEALDINHVFLTKCFGDRLHFAPIGDNLQRVLDVGTGGGRWAMDFADVHPNTAVRGTDISPIQPSWVPPNLKFDIEDCTSQWTFSPATFDFIHMRYLVGSIADWDELFRQAYAATKPGGWVESIEASPHMVADDGSVAANSAISQWGKIFEDGGSAMGRSFMVVDEGTQRAAMEQAGFVDIGEQEIQAPVGSWPEDETQRVIGQLSKATLEHDIEGFVLYIASVILNWDRETILVYIALLRRDIRLPEHHASFKIKSVWGRRPF